MGKRTMTDKTRGTVTRRRLTGFAGATTLFLLLFGLLAVPQSVQAWPTKYSSCSGCHSTADANATVSVAVDGIAGTTVSTAPGATFELDFIVRNISGAGVMGVEIALPTGWTIANGTVNAPALTGWNSVWNVAAGASWATANGYSTATQFAASPLGYTINFAGTGWDSGNRDAALDAGIGGDLDGVANIMGADVRVTVPGGTANGNYTIQLTGVGHDGTKAFKSQAVTVTVAGGGDSTAPVPGTVSVTPQSGSFVPGTFTITTAFTDAESAVTACDYMVNGVTWVAGVVSGAGPYTCTANPLAQGNGSSLTINMRANSSGGTGTATSIARTVDALAPTTTSNAPVGWQNANQTVTLTPTDGTGSGVASTQYCVDTTNVCVPGTAGTSVSVTQTAGTAGTQYVRYRSTDNLSQVETTKSATVQIDLSAPTNGSLSATPGNSQNALSWSGISDTGSGLRTGTIYDVRFLAGGTAPTCATGTSLYTGDNLTYTHTSLVNGNTYSYRVCAYDNVNNVSAGATATGTPTATCTPVDPTMTIVEADQQITSGSGSVVYTVDVTNNDSVDCTDTTFSLNVNDSNVVAFQASTLGTASLLVAPGATNSTTLTVTAVASPTNGASNNSIVSTVAAGPHASVQGIASTLINLPRTPTINYNIGEIVHFEYRSTTRFTSQGSSALSLYDSSSASILVDANMVETQVGAAWVYTYDWDTSGQSADTYRVKIHDSFDANPSNNTKIVLGNALAQLHLFTDAGYTTPTDIFSQGATVYAEVLLPSPETATASSDVTNWYNAGAYLPTLNVTQTGSIYRFNFTIDFNSASINDGDWGWFYWAGQDTGIDFHQPIQRNDASCGSCNYTDPTVAIITGNQTVASEAGTVNYTINVTNNDTVACGSTSFDLVAIDTNSTNFDPSAFALDPITVSPGLTAATTLDVTAKAAQPNLVTNDSYFYTAADGNHAQSANSGTVTTTLDVADIVAPTVDSFTLPATSTSLTVAVTTFTASDNSAVTGYIITESAVAPLAGSGGWSGTAPATYTVAADGSYTLYAWAKDAAGNVSTSLFAPVTVDASAPVVTSFTMPSTSTNLIVPITQFLASDGIGVTGYKVTVSAVQPNAGDAGWTGTAPVNYTVASDGSYTFYAWAKDALGNVSVVYGAPPTVTVDTTAPFVTTTVPANSATAVSLNSDVTINFSEPVDCSTINTTNIVSDNPAWSYDGTSCAVSGGTQAVFNTGGQAYLTAYSVSVSSGVRDLVGNILSPAPYNVTYTTETESCVYSVPSVVIDTANQNVTSDGDWLNYLVTIVNNDTGGCGNTTFNLTLSDSNGIDFDPSAFDSATIALAPAASGSRNLTVKAKSGALNGASNNTYFYTAADGNHLQSANSGAATTIIAVPCNVAPTVSYLTANQSITSDGGNAVYTVQVQNDNALACGTGNFNLVAVDDNSTSFATPSVFLTDPLGVNPGGATNTTTLTVSAQGGAANLAANNTYFYTAVNGSIPQSGNSPTRTTTINRPCVPAPPSFSHAVNKNIAADGSAVYDMTIINNDVDCPASLFTFNLDSEVESNVGTFTLPSLFSAPSVSVASGATNSTVTFTVTGNGTGVVFDTLTSTIRIADGSHVDQTTVPVTTIKPFDPLVHSSASTGSTKHSADLGWGVAGGKYGEFTCATCHEPATTNIKRIRTVLPNAPDTSKGNFPGAGAGISFLDSTAPTTDFGDDAAAPRASSNRVCEVCHTYDASKTTGVVYHAYNQQVAAGHEDSNDCTSCHKHNDGFSKAGATCDSCHGYPPQPGNIGTIPVRADDGFGYQAVEGKGAHAEHVSHLATLAGVTLDPNSDSFGDANVAAVCGACHDMNGATHEMGGGAGANRIINFNGSTAFQFGAAAPVYNGIEDSPSATTPKTCSNINCHFQSTPWWE